MGKQAENTKKKHKKETDQEYVPESAQKCRKNHRIGFNVRIKIINKKIIHQGGFSTRDAISRYKTKDSTIKSIKKQIANNNYITFFSDQSPRWKLEVEVMNTVFQKQMSLAQQNKGYVQALHQLFYQTDIPNFYQAQTLDQYNQQQRRVIQHYLDIYDTCCPKDQNQYEKETKEEENQFQNEDESISYNDST